MACIPFFVNYKIQINIKMTAGRKEGDPRNLLRPNVSTESSVVVVVGTRSLPQTKHMGI